MAFTSYPWSNIHELNLEWLIKNMRLILTEIEKLDALQKEFLETTKYLNDELDKISANIDRIDKLYADFVDEVNERFTELKAELLTDFESLRNAINAQFILLENNVNDELDEFRADMADMEITLYNTINNLPSVVEMINPYTGEMDSLQNIIYAIAGADKTDSLTASEYDALALTANAYDAYNITAYNYDWHGKTILV